ncbi:MAG: hypothetical protein JWQ66_2136 [Mucilaginibacter sp.]|nr:hypothetical protein [Mucilaginibacter sp.]
MPSDYAFECPRAGVGHSLMLAHFLCFNELKNLLIDFLCAFCLIYFSKEKGKKESNRKCLSIAKRKRNKCRRLNEEGTNE